MNKQKTRITLDVAAKESYKVVHAKVGDNARQIIADIKDNGEAYDLTGVSTVEVRCRKADGKQVTKNVTKSGGQVLIDVDGQMTTCKGMCTVDVVLYGSAAEVLSTANFRIDVGEGAINEDGEESTDDYESLKEALARVETAKKTADTAMSTAGEAQKKVDKLLEKTVDYAKQEERIVALEADDSTLKKDVQELDSKKITKFYTNSQGAIQLDDSDDGKIQDLMIYGKSEQAQYEGINLLNYSKETVTASGITLTYDKESQTYKVNGTATKQVNKSIFEAAENIYVGKKIVGCPSGGNTNTYNIVIMYLDGAGVWKNESYDTGNGHIIEDSPKLSISILVRKGVTANNLVFKPMIVEDTTKTYDDFEPYVGGKPSPSPEYPQEIKAVVNPVIKTYGKNLLKVTSQNKFQDGITCVNNGDGTYTMNGTATKQTDFYIYGNYDNVVRVLIDSRKTYIVKKSGNSNVQYHVGIADRYTVMAGIGDAQIKNQAGISYFICRILSGATLNNFTIYPQIEEGSVSTDFKPYQESQATLPYELNAIPVSSGGNVTIDGQQYVADYVDVERGKLVRKTHVTKFTGAENWVYTESDKESTRRFGVPMQVKGVPYLGLSNYAINTNKLIVNKENAFAFYGTWADVRITKFTSLAEFKNFLSEMNSGGKPMIVIYALVTPEEVDLTPEAIEAFKTLSTYYPKTYVDAESEQLEAYTTFNYPVSMQNGWNYVKQQINDNRDYIYNMEVQTQTIDTQAAEAYVNSEYAVALMELGV